MEKSFATFILEEEDWARKMEIMYYLAKKGTIFFDKSVLFKTEIARQFIEYMKIDVSKVMGKMIKVIGIVYDMTNNCCRDTFWNGWLSTEELTVISKA